jgi:hypothetical protein
MSWVMVAALTVPHAAFAAFAKPHEQAVQEVLTDGELALAFGTGVPTAKLGDAGQKGFLTVKRIVAGSLSCGVPHPSSSKVIDPSHGNRVPPCNDSIPIHTLNDDGVAVFIGGSAAVRPVDAPPTINVYVNGTQVPANQMGTAFQTECPRDFTEFGTAFVGGETLNLYDCKNQGNAAVIPINKFHIGFNTITVSYAWNQAAFFNGDDTRDRIIAMQ